MYEDGSSKEVQNIYIYIVNCHFDETAFLALEGEIK
jgi:hypothetical protein